MTVGKLLELALLVDKTAEFNYSKKRTNTSSTKKLLERQWTLPRRDPLALPYEMEQLITSP